MFDQTLKLKRARNGWIVQGEEADGAPSVKEEIDEENNQEAFADFLRIINEQFGPTDGKYSYKRIRIVCVPGRDYNGEMEDSYLEKLRWLRDELNYVLRKKWKRKKSAGTRTRTS